MVGFWNGQKTKFMKILLSPGVPYISNFAMNLILKHYMGHELHIDVKN